MFDVVADNVIASPSWGAIDPNTENLETQRFIKKLVDTITYHRY